MNLKTTYSFGLIGYPLGHSLSPQLHRAALKALNLSGDYYLFPAAPGRDFTELVEQLVLGLRSGELHGINVTIPHKQSIMPWLDDLTETARAVGAVNTIIRQNGRLVGDNTDAPGFLADLKACGILPTDKLSESQSRPSAVVLGAGGSARAVVYALAAAGWSVTIAARRPEQAHELVERLKPYLNEPILNTCPLTPAGLQDINWRVGTSTLIVNTTPLGMSPAVNTCPWFPEVDFPPGAQLYDLVYNPSETLLVRRAREAGLVAVSGIGMLIEQAALAFERWTGLGAPRAAMREQMVKGDNQ